MDRQLTKNQEMDLNDMGTAIMGFLMGVLATGGIWFTAGFIWEIIKMMGRS